MDGGPKSDGSLWMTWMMSGWIALTGGFLWGEPVQESFEQFQVGVASRIKSDSTFWQFSLPGVESADGKGLMRSRAIMLTAGPAGNQAPGFTVAVPGVEKQEIDFWVKLDPSEGQYAKFSVVIRPDKKGADGVDELARFILSNQSKVAESYPVVSFTPDLTGWTHVKITLDHSKPMMKVATSPTKVIQEDDELPFGPDSWSLPPVYRIQVMVNYAKSKWKGSLYFDDFSWLPAPPAVTPPTAPTIP